ncbi:class I SAM-dependent methyltransferase [Clostridium hydrogenum]|uniref:class I SAM-dependent methyltransferase n=1 Tax=Clostridium hydrogenum TaxID=2855764 RepID=UPI001F433EB9|nr:class I SAM-dependent methyltransferase [Clostridium hydrogenum]
MLKENKFVIWGTYCECKNECSILQNEHHPWVDTEFTVKLKCNCCGKEITIDRKKAEEFYNNKIYSYYNSLYGNIVDLGCGDGFLSRFLIKQNKVEKIYGLDIDDACLYGVADIIGEKFQFIQSDIKSIGSNFKDNNIDFLVSRDVFMFIEDTDRYFDDVTKIVSKGIRQMGWYIEDNVRMKNKLKPEQIAKEYIKRGWKVEMEYLDWYKYGYFIRANKV